MSKARRQPDGAAPRQAFIAPYHDPSLQDDLTNPECDPRPWAAYTLGHETLTLLKWIELPFEVCRTGSKTLDGLQPLCGRFRYLVSARDSDLDLPFEFSGSGWNVWDGVPVGVGRLRYALSSLRKESNPTM